jgi:hypothetical protein
MAGALPTLRRRPRTAAAIYREWQRPDASEQLKLSIVEAVTRAGTEAASLDLGQPLDELMRQAATKLGGRLILILDQFEGPSPTTRAREDGLTRARTRREPQRRGRRAHALCARTRAQADRLGRGSSIFGTGCGWLLASRPPSRRSQASRYNERHDGAAARPVGIQDELVAKSRQVRSGQVHLGASSGVAKCAQ